MPSPLSQGRGRGRAQVLGRRNPTRCALDSLEPRCLLSATAAVVDGTLRVTGDDSGNAISVSPAPGAPAGAVTVTANGLSLGTFTNVSAIDVQGGNGSDQLTAGAGLTQPVTLAGGNGDDSFLALSRATILPGGGTDAFWAGQKTPVTLVGATPVEAKRGINRLPATFSAAPVSAQPNKPALSAAAKDPRLTPNAISTAAFSSVPLFSPSGPTAADIHQGALNDCYLLAALGSVATTDPSLIYQTITDLGNGTYAVRIMHGKTAKYYDVDADLPTTYGGDPAYAGLGDNSVLWVALFEKAFAIDRGGSYAKLDTGGWMGNVYTALGLTTKTVAANAYAKLAAALATGNAVTVSTNVRQSATSPLVPNHAYTIESIQLDAKGRLLSMTLRNPWGLDGSAVGDEFTIGATDARGLAAAALGIA
jgi:hypothetical protein